MPMHDWARVKAGIFHHFHHEWISAITRTLNARLPKSFYALTEQQAAGFGPDVLTLHDDCARRGEPDKSTSTATVIRPKARLIETTDAEFYARKKAVLQFVTSAAIELSRSWRSFRRATAM